MKVICTKCEGMHVACEAMINPNDKSFHNYTDEAFIYGWCDDCMDGVVLSDIDEVKEDIDKLYADFCAAHGKEPLYAQCSIVWKGEKFVVPTPAIIKLSTDADDATDDKVFYYCNSIGQLKSLTEFGSEDFVIAECGYLTNEP